MRDVEVRKLAKKKLNLCEKCIRKFTKQELEMLISLRD